MIDRGQQLKPRPLPGAVLAFAGALLTAMLALLVAVGPPRLADARPSMGSNCSGCHGTTPSTTSKPETSKKAVTAAPAQAPAVVPQTSSDARVQDYIPWTLVDPYYSHFLYRADDYRN